MNILNFKSHERTLNLSEIYKDDGIYPRDKVEEKRIDFFSELMQDGTVFPPIKVAKDVSGKYVILDGFHRYSAYKKLQRTETLCDLVDAEPKMWRLLSVRFNFDSSQPLKLGEIKRAIRNAWRRDDIRDKHQIAGMVGCTIQWARKVTKSLDLEEDAEKLILARKIQQEENIPIRDIAERVGWTKSKAHRMLNEPPKTIEPTSRLDPQKEQTAEASRSAMDSGKQKPNDPPFCQAERIIENFDRFEHKWETEQKETLYAFDGIKNDLSVETISKHIDKNPAWVRNTAHILLYIFQNDADHAGHLSEISETLSVGIERTRFIHWLFTHWPNTLPERKPLFKWILTNQSQYRDERVNKILRFEHLFWHRENNDEEAWGIDGSGNRLLKELPAEKLGQLGQTTLYFEDLKKYIRNYKIETVLAKDLLERLNLIMISQNRIQDHLRKFV